MPSILSVCLALNLTHSLTHSKSLKSYEPILMIFGGVIERSPKRDSRLDFWVIVRINEFLMYVLY